MLKEDTSVVLFMVGNAVVHRDYGVGRIVAIEDKFIGGAENTYYRVEMENNSTVWVPVAEEGPLRLVSSPDEFAEAVAVLQRPSRKMNSTFQTRVARIRKASDKGTPVALARVVRDLWARQKRRGHLSNTEDRFLNNLTQRLLSEWAASMNLDKDKVNERLSLLLQKNGVAATGS